MNDDIVRAPADTPLFHVGPGAHHEVVEQILAAGGELVATPAEARAVVWVGFDPAAFPTPVPDGVRWVQLAQAGVDRWLAAGLVDDQRTWTSAAGAFGAVVAERAVALLLAGIHRLPEHARSTTWTRIHGGSVAGERVLVVGTGAIGREAAWRLAALGATPIGCNRSGAPVAGFAEVVPSSSWPSVCREVGHVILAAPLTSDTRGMVAAEALGVLPTTAVVVNVGRGGLVDTEALVAALREGRVGGACLDVTDPEPLPPEHPLWREPRVLVTSHTANPPPERDRLLLHHIGENVRRWLIGEPLLGVIEPQRGY